MPSWDCRPCWPVRSQRQMIRSLPPCASRNQARRARRLCCSRSRDRTGPRLPWRRTLSHAEHVQGSSLRRDPCTRGCAKNGWTGVCIMRSPIWSPTPVTEKHVAQGMTLSELCEATITMSDNTAGNLLLNAVGGPKDLQRSCGHPATKPTGLMGETGSNSAIPDDPRDTTTPRALRLRLCAVCFSKTS